MATKSNQARSFVKAGDWKKALAIVKTFTINVTKTQKRYIDIAHECIDNPSRSKYYETIGVNVEEFIERAKSYAEDILNSSTDEKAKVYTSYYGKLRKLDAAGIMPIRTSVGLPRYLPQDMAKYMALAPRPEMLKMEWKDYLVQYHKILAALDPETVYQDLLSLGEGSDVAIMCFEKDHNDCHRCQAANWLRENGYEVTEFTEQ